MHFETAFAELFADATNSRHLVQPLEQNVELASQDTSAIYRSVANQFSPLP